MEGERHICVTCRARAPETETNYTLISARHGWRLHRVQLEGGTYGLEWYCPRCWARRKAERGSPPSSGRIGR